MECGHPITQVQHMSIRTVGEKGEAKETLQVNEEFLG